MRVSGLYAVTPDLSDSELLLEKVELALKGGTTMLQYRNKSAPSGLREEQAVSLTILCRRFSVPLIVNDDVKLAKKIGADGVHLGRNDVGIASAREFLGAKKIIGASCYNRLKLAQQCLHEGADYLAFGSFFPSANKPGAVVPPLSLLKQARAELSAPIVAIGGINLENARDVVAAGADALAIISALFDASDIRAAAQRFSSLFERRALA